MTPRFTIDGSEALEQLIASTCNRAREGVLSVVPAGKLDGILLGGGYGRGEGGVLRTPEGDKPYNDLEFYVFIRGNALLVERRYRRPLHDLGEHLSPSAGLEVEFKVLTLEKLRRSAPSMFYYDLVAGHRRTYGDDALLDGCEHHRNAEAIPLHEATRLLFNRCSGLLFSLERLRRPRFGADEADFVGRNLAKAQLAFGDVLLAAQGQYHWSCRTRHERLATIHFGEDLAWAAPLKGHHATGVEFKLNPIRSTESRETLASRHAEVSALGRKLWLWLESKRLGRPFASATDYAFSRIDKCPETSAVRNRFVNLRAFGSPGLVSTRYPRERLFHALALLLWENQPWKEAALLRRIQEELRTGEPEFSGLVWVYQQLWNRFN
ncbi:MAG TPA: hypothetical protein P5186_00130 [Candidatus Paceibacterota bacterium]|nr:hypothetical protein [Verrucomicrobiota bacterium]HRY46432.1 hypothetical protein [Candidatus Paceibacterota bacterium]HRZ99375.1 hypothetical protein [Candidatus Paceibacterota bacterium]